MSKRRSHVEEIQQEAPEMAQFRREAEEHAERAERARLEHRAAELDTTVDELRAGLRVEEEVPVLDAHVRESLVESERAAKLA